MKNTAGPSVSPSRFLLLFPFLLAVAVMSAYLFVFERSLLKSSGGIFGYPLDDPFIHMTIARNLAFHGSWGINPGEFASASSSLLYPILLAALFRIFGFHFILPFIVNAVAAVILFCTVNAWLIKQEISTAVRCVILLILLVLVPVPVLVLIGMEHTLQVLFSFLFMTSLADYLAGLNANNAVAKDRLPWKIPVYAFCVGAIRFESIFLIGIAFLLLLFYRRFRSGIVIAAAGFLPVVVFGFYSVHRGSFFLPNSVLMKSQMIPMSLSGIIEYVKNIVVYKLSLFPLDTVSSEQLSFNATIRLLILLPLAYLIFSKAIDKKPGYGILIIMISVCTLLQVSLAATGWFFRYEAYLLLPGLCLLAVMLYRYGREFSAGRPPLAKAMLGLLLFAAFLPYFIRGGMAFSLIKRACLNIVQQQVQSGRFVRKYYNHSTVALNDIGAVSAYSEAKIIDLYGLANIDVTRSAKGHYMTSDFLDSLVKADRSDFAIVYKDYFKADLLNRWTVVASMEMPDNVVCGSPFVYFYVFDPAKKSGLEQNLHDFEKSAPAEVKFTYY